MPVLSRRLYEELCDLNKAYLRDQNLIIEEDVADIELGEDQHRIIIQLIKNERDIVESCNKNYKKAKDKAKSIILFMSAAVVLLGAGFALASFILSIVLPPVILVLLSGFAIVGVAKFFLNLKVNQFKTSADQCSNTLEQLKEVDKNVGREIIINFNNEIQEIKKVTESLDDKTVGMSEKIDMLGEKITQNTSQLLVKLGTFSTSPILVSNADSANELHDRERTSSPIHS